MCYLVKPNYLQGTNIFLFKDFLAKTFTNTPLIILEFRLTYVIRGYFDWNNQKQYESQVRSHGWL